jgi:hypothetical protein
MLGLVPPSITISLTTTITITITISITITITITISITIAITIAIVSSLFDSPIAVTISALTATAARHGRAPTNAGRSHRIR